MNARRLIELLQELPEHRKDCEVVYRKNIIPQRGFARFSYLDVEEVIVLDLIAGRGITVIISE